MPEKLVHGIFSVYETPDHGFKIVYRRDGSEEDETMDIPGHIVKLGKMMAEGKLNPLSMLTKMRGNGNGLAD